MRFKPLLERVDRWQASKKNGGLVWERDVLECLKEFKHVLDKASNIENNLRKGKISEEVLMDYQLLLDLVFGKLENSFNEIFGEVSKRNGEYKGV